MKREEIIQAIVDKFREMSLETIMFHQAVADVLGLHIIDRLEHQGYARRTNDPKDRRRTIVEPIANRKLERKIETTFKPLHERMHDILSSYADSELAFLFDAMTKFIEQTRQESKRLRASQK